MKKIEIGKNAKVQIEIDIDKTLLTKEEERNIISKMSKKYNIPTKNISISKNYISHSLKDYGLAGDIVQNPNDPKFMQELMKIWMKNNDIKDVSFDDILKIDSQINSLIDFDVYEKGKKYSIKWVKWSNFLSYGPDNFFDFTKLKGLILLCGKPANKSGKSTFAYDLIHFLLFGKTNTNKAKKLGGLFNRWLPNEKNLNVEGCINIDGDDYIIKRTLTRSDGKRKDVTNKVEYYKVLENGEKDLLPEVNEQGASTTATSKIIKEALGNENDFDLIISANSKDLDNLIDLGETEKGRLLSKWIGLTAIEDKDIKAREKWNKELSKGRYCDMYNRVALENEIKILKEENENFSATNENLKQLIENSIEKITSYNSTRDALLSSKLQIDNSLIKIDVATLEASMEKIREEGIKKKAERDILEKEINSYENISYSEEEYKTLKKEKDEIIIRIADIKAEGKHLKETNENLAKAEYCPTCQRKLDNVDNTKTINANNKKIEALRNEYEIKKNRFNELNSNIENIEIIREKALEKSQKEVKMAGIDSFLANKKTEYLEKKQILKEITANKEAISKNSEIDAKINVINVNIQTEEKIKLENENTINTNNRSIKINEESIKNKNTYILKINEEQKIEKNWKLYLQMIGKDGISKMVVKNTLPIINNEINSILNDACDFNIEITMDEKNNIEFSLIRDNVVIPLPAASGLERTQASLALRVVLGKLSKLSRPPFILLDEILGTVASENFDDMKKIYDRIVKEFEFILHITHIESIADWHNDTILVQKIDNISSIK